MTFPLPNRPSDAEEQARAASYAANGHDSPAAEQADAVMQDYGLPRPLAASAVADDWVEPAPARPRGQPAKRARRLALELVQTLLLAILIFLAVRAMAQNFRVEGSSMEPGLHNGQYLLVNKAVYFKLDLETLDKYLPFIDPGDDPQRYVFHGPKRGEVVVFHFPSDPDRDFIKRVIGVPGDRVRLEDGKVFVNDVQLSESYINGESRSNYEEKVVPPGHYFVLGDNRGNSSDSRSWGFVPEENIIGRAMFTYWPRIGGVGNHSINLGVITLPLP